MKITTLLCLLFFIEIVCYSQNLNSEFDNYLLSGVGYISIPSNMEIQSGNYKKYMDGVHKKYGKLFGYEVTDNSVVFQQKGLNDLSESGFETYARVIMETNIVNYGDFEKLTTKITATQTELNEYSKQSKIQMEKNFSGTSLKLIDWYGISIELINGLTVMKMSYLRQASNRPYVVVKIYSFQNNDRMHVLTLSYRQSDENLWRPLFDKVLESFTITNVR